MTICEKCGGVMKVIYTWKKGDVRKRVRKCHACGHSYSTTETVDVHEAVPPLQPSNGVRIESQK